MVSGNELTRRVSKTNKMSVGREFKVAPRGTRPRANQSDAAARTRRTLRLERRPSWRHWEHRPTPHASSSSLATAYPDWLSLGFASHTTQNRSFPRRSSQPISSLRTEGVPRTFVGGGRRVQLYRPHIRIGKLYFTSPILVTRWPPVILTDASGNSFSNHRAFIYWKPWSFPSKHRRERLNIVQDFAPFLNRFIPKPGFILKASQNPFKITVLLF